MPLIAMATDPFVNAAGFFSIPNADRAETVQRMPSAT